MKGTLRPKTLPPALARLVARYERNGGKVQKLPDGRAWGAVLRQKRDSKA